MTVREAMTNSPQLATPEMILRDVARLMRDNDIGSLPVVENDRMVGMITDRDITIRAVAAGRDVNTTPVRDAMTARTLYVYEDEEIEQAAHAMADLQVRRLPVLNRNKQLVGILALSDVSLDGPERSAAEALRGVSIPTP